jgi:hypothetical protein
MIGDYLVVATVFGIVVSYVSIIHHFWLRDAFEEEAQPSATAKEEGPGGNATPIAAPHRESRGLSRPGILSESSHEPTA